MSDYEPWMEKCLVCRHSYKKIGDAETIYCRKKTGCKFEPFMDNDCEEAKMEVEHDNNRID